MMPQQNKTSDPNLCPLCGEANDCQLCTPALYKGPCWCSKWEMPDELIAQVPARLKNQACICARCVANFLLKQAQAEASPKILPGDFYFEQGRMVFNEAYHLRRGFCCKSGCRHCPYAKPPPAA